MLETLFLNHGHCTISWGKILFFWGSPFKGLLWILWQEITSLEQGDVLTCSATRTCRCVKYTANPTQNHLSMLWRRCWPWIKAKSRAIWVVGSLRPWFTCWTQNCFSFTSPVSFGQWGVSRKEMIKKKLNTLFLLISGVWSANVMWESSCKCKRKISYKIWRRT